MKIITNSSAPQSAAYGIWSDGPGASIDLSSATIQTDGLGAQGKGSDGVLASSGGMVTLTGGSVTTQADSASGLSATGGGTITTLGRGGTAITTSGSGAYGVEADTGGTVSLTGGQVTTSGAGSRALYAIGSSGAASAIGANGVAVQTNQANSIGANASGAGAIITTGVNGVVYTTIATLSANSPGAQADSGGQINLTGGKVTTSGTGSIGLYAIGGSGVASSIIASAVGVLTGSAIGVEASAGGTVALDGGSVMTTGAAGLYATGGGAINTNLLAAVGTTVSTSGSFAYGVEADTAGKVSLNGGSVTTSGGGATGLYANGAAIDASGVAVVTGSGTNNAAIGVEASAGGAATINGGSVATSGAAGLYATGGGAITTNLLAGVGATVSTTGANAIGAQADTGGVLILNGGSISTGGAGAIGVEALTGGSAALDGVSITTSGQDAHGLAVVGAGSKTTLAGPNAIVTQGKGAIGLYASGNGVLNASGATTVTTSGGVSATTGAYGVNADGAGSAVNLASATVKTSGAGATGLLASDVKNSGAAGSIIITGPLSITTTNPAATAIALQGDGASIVATGGGTIASAGGAIAFLGGTNQTATFDNVGIANQTGDLIFADPSVATVNFNGVTANAGTNNLLNATNGSFVTLNAAASTLIGAISTVSASTSTVNLNNGSTWTGAITTDSTSTSTVNLGGGSSWNLTASSILTNLAVANSYVVFAPPAGSAEFKVLTLSNYVGSGGFVTMNAMLGGAGSPSDQIVINGGKAMGSTLLTVRNVGGLGGQTTGAGIPVIVAVNGGTIAQNAFALATTPVVGGYAYNLEQDGQDLYLVSTPTTTTAQLTNSVTNVTKAQQQALTTGRVLGSILLGATEQVSCSNCSSGFGSIGSYALGAHGRTSITPELTAMGGFSYDEYTAQGITVSNAPTFAGSLVYDPINFGKSRPFFEVGGGLVPFEQIRYERTYPYGAQIAEGQGNAINRSLGVFARVGWVDRVTPIDEAAVYTDISRSWLTAGGYTEASIGNNPYPATVSTGLEALDVVRLGGQYTHLFGGQFEANVSAAVAYGFNSLNSAQWNVADFGLIPPTPLGNSVWYEWGARVGYRVSQRMVVDAFLLGTLGGQIGTTIHGGIGLRYLF